MVKARLAAQTSAHRSTARAQGTSLRIMICLPMPLILSHTSSVVHLLVTGFTYRFTPAAGWSPRALHLRSAIGWIISDLRKACASVPGLAERVLLHGPRPHKT